MNPTVVGFEGFWPEESPLAWGAAALVESPEDDGPATNSLSRATTDRARFKLLCDEGAVTPTPNIALNEHSPAVVVALRRTFSEYNLFLNDNPWIGKKTTKTAIYRVYRYPDQFQRYAERVATDICAHVLQEQKPSPTDDVLLRAALALKQDAPLVHATRYLRGDSKARLKLDAIARASIRDDERRSEYEMLRDGLSDEFQTFGIKYQDGIARGGGMDVDDTIIQLDTFKQLHPPFTEDLKKRHPVLEHVEHVPFPRLRELKAASAGLEFAIHVDGEPPIVRLARYLELKMLEDAVKGKLPHDVTPEVRQALQQMLHPNEYTQVFHHALKSTGYEDVAYEKVSAEDLRPGPLLDIFCFVEGVARDTQKVELKASRNLRINVSRTDNGFGEEPDGATEFSFTRDFLFEPTTVRIQRFSTQTGRKQKFYLQSVRFVEPDTSQRFGWIPSHFFPGSFVRIPQARAEISGAGTLSLNGKELSSDGLKVPSHERTVALLEQFESWCLEQELSASPSADDWILPTQPKDSSFLVQLALTLPSDQSEIPFNGLLDLLQRDSDHAVRAGRVRRQIVRNQRFVATRVHEDQDEDVTVFLTNDGARLASLCQSHQEALADRYRSEVMVKERSGV